LLQRCWAALPAGLFFWAPARIACAGSNGSPEFGEAVLHMRRDDGVLPADDDAVAFEVVQGLGEEVSPGTIERSRVNRCGPRLRPTGTRSVHLCKDVGRVVPPAAFHQVGTWGG